MKLQKERLKLQRRLDSFESKRKDIKERGFLIWKIKQVDKLIERYGA